MAVQVQDFYNSNKYLLTINKFCILMLCLYSYIFSNIPCNKTIHRQQQQKQQQQRENYQVLVMEPQ